MNPKLSVIITTYNRPESLRRAIKSVLNQNFKDFELIVVDDGSSAETEKTVKSFNDTRIFFVRNSRNLGGTRSLNVGLEKSKGEYVCPLDDDDEWIDSRKLSKQIGFFKKHPDYLVVGTNAKVRLLNEDGNLIRELTTDVPLSHEEIHNRMLFANSIAHVTSMYSRKKALEVGDYDESLERGKDWDLFLKLGKIGKLANIPDVSVRFDEKRKVKLKYKDSKAKIRIIWRHKDYPHFLQSFITEFMRMCAFGILNLKKR